VLVCLNKVDVLRAHDPEQLRVLSRSLRAICHSAGCSLLYTSRDDKNSLNILRSRLNRHVLNKEFSAAEKQKSLCEDHQKGLYVFAGTDSFDKIGSAPFGPQINKTFLIEAPGGTAVAAWIQAAARMFPLKDEEIGDLNKTKDALKLSQTSDTNNFSKENSLDDNAFKENVIDDEVKKRLDLLTKMTLDNQLRMKLQAV